MTRLCFRPGVDILALRGVQRSSQVQCTPDVVVDITFQQEMKMASVSDLDRATPKPQSALLEAMQEKTVTVGKQPYPLDLPFVVLATLNPLELEATYPLPEAQLDRFFIKLRMDFPGVDDIHTILDRTTYLEEPSVDRV